MIFPLRGPLASSWKLTCEVSFDQEPGIDGPLGTRPRFEDLY